MMDHALDPYLDRQDQLAIEDGEAEAHAHCWCCDYDVPDIAMPSLPGMTCAWCENDIRDVDEFTERCEKIREGLAGRTEPVQLTLEDARGG